MPDASPIEVFISYAHKDERLTNKLRTHLRLLQRQGVIADWHDRDITAGDNWKGQIDVHLTRARIILLLVSPDFLASDYCYDVELKRAMSRHRAGRAVVIPVFLRPCDWKGAPFGKLQGLPTDAEPVASRRWSSQDEAFTIVARGIRAAVEKHRKEWQGASPPTPPPAPGPVPKDAPKPSSRAPVKPAATRNPKPAAAQSKRAAARPAGQTAEARSSRVDNTGAWVLLGDRLFLSKGVAGQPDGSVEVRIAPGSAEEEADLRALGSERAGSGNAVPFAHQNQAFWARVRPLGSVSGTGRSVHTLHLTPDSGLGNAWIEMGYNGLSADQVAEARARLLLLNEKPASVDRWQGSFLSDIAVSQGGGQPLSESPFPTLWQEARRQAPAFLRRARLQAVFYLKASGLCEHILELGLGPIQVGQLAVHFRGRRRKVYDNREATVIQVTGTCPLAA